MTYTKIISFVLAPLLIASSAMSQTADWEAVQALRSGTKIKVTLKNRPTFGHCFMDGASDDQLFCTSRGGLLSRRKVYLRDDIEAVYLTHNGPAIGLGVGAAAGAIIGSTGDPVPGLGRGGTALLDAGLLGGLGAFFGLVLDPFFHGRVVYRSPGSPNGGSHSSISKKQNASPPTVDISCLKNGVTLPWVEP